MAKQLKPFKKGVTKPEKPATLMGRIRDIMMYEGRLDGAAGYRIDACANAFVSQMEGGSFAHLKEYIDREEGKVPTRIADAEGGKIKLYAGVPLDDDEDAP